MSAINKNDFNVGCFNIGNRITDYRRLKAYKNGEILETLPNTHGWLPRLEADAFEAVKREYCQAEQNTIQALNSLERTHVYFLQEVSSAKRPLIRNFTNKHYTLIHRYENDPNRTRFDTALLIDTRRFKDIQNHSTTIPLSNHRFKDVAIASAVDRVTKEHFLFASLHAPGFDLSKREIQEMKEGNDYCYLALAAINDLALKILKPETTRIVCGDINCNPETGDSRFDLFNEYKILRTGQPTNVNPSKPFGSPARNAELDFIFFAPFKQEITAKTMQNNAISWDNNCSDHLPVFAKITTIQAASQPFFPKTVPIASPAPLFPALAASHATPAPKLPSVISKPVEAPIKPVNSFSAKPAVSAARPSTFSSQAPKTGRRVKFSKTKSSKKKAKNSSSSSTRKSSSHKKSRSAKKSPQQQLSLVSKVFSTVKNFFLCLCCCKPSTPSLTSRVRKV